MIGIQMGNIVVLGIDTPPPPDAIPPASATPPVPHPKSDIEACCVAVQADSLPPVPTIRRNSNALGSLHSVQSLHTLHSVRAVVAPPSPSSPPSPTQPLRAHTAPAAADLTLPEAPDMSLQEVIASAGQLRLSAISTPLPLDPKTSTESVVASPSNTHPGDVSVSDASRISRLDIPFPFRALALYDYTASPDDPTELSFARCDVLQIADIRGKWWYARRVSANGLSAVGIVPSNFMRLLSQ
ncbi:Transmembrane osmosensor [Polyrhizophydium stewartii]|uniref:Transmembrane osmosensor n=1 Tax=Polyrhizophydium stewartii TaxID=2732419 RepID=A0ABR4N5Z2_9FUNG